MHTIDHYFSFWPIFLGSLIFFLLGLLLYLISERAMERSEKDLGWIRSYRRPGFLFRKELLPWGGVNWFALVGVLLFAVLFRIGLRVNSYYFIIRRWVWPPVTRYHAAALVAAALGAGCVYLIVQGIFESRFAAFWSAMLFAASPLRGHGVLSLTALSVLLLLLYLRTEKPGFPAELLYLAAILVMAPAIGACHPLVWMIPVLILVHLYKLVWQLRGNHLSGLELTLALVAALFCWLVCIILAALLRRFIISRYSLHQLLALFNPLRIRYACSELAASIRHSLFSVPRPGLLVSPMTDAPLLGLGTWGLISAIGMAAKRRSVRGLLAAGLLVILGLIWLLSAQYLLPLGFAVALGAMLKNAEIGRRRLPAALICGLGLVCDLALTFALWAMPLYIVLVERIFYV